jgi:YHS domain-containing protein
MMTLTRRAFVCFAFCLGLCTAWAGAARAEEPEIFAKGGIAIAGYDVVIYFTQNRAVKGEMSHAIMWRGATWLFATDETMEAFEMNPHGYAPQYGGYCAYAVAQGQTAPSDPKAFTVHEGKLYLNNSAQVRDLWSGDAEANISAADQNWPSVLNR